MGAPESCIRYSLIHIPVDESPTSRNESVEFLIFYEEAHPTKATARSGGLNHVIK